MAITSPIFKSSSQAKKGIDGSVETIKNIGKILFRKQKIKRESFAQTNLIKGKRRENDRRQQLEDELEAPKIVTRPTGPAQLVQKSNNRGWFDRILGFIGYLSAGWILNNLPTWIGIGKEFIARLQRAGQIMSDFYFSTVGIFRGMIQIFGSLGENLIRLDFLDTSNRVKSSISDLNLQIEKWTSTVEEALGLVTTPITEGKYSGQNIPGVGTEVTNQGAYVEPGQGNYPGGTGGTVSPQQIYSYLRSKNISHIHALGITANILGESGFRVDADETGKGTGGIGLFQYTYPSRKQAFLRAVPNWRKDWKGQVDYAIHQDPNTPLYLRKQFSSPEEAADDFMRNWENPSKSVYTERRRKHNQFIKSFKPGGEQTQMQQVPVGNINPTVGDRLGAGRGHQGVDLQVKEGTPLRAISDGVIVDSDYEKGWGNFLVMKDNLGIYHLYGHMQSGYKKGGSVKKGEVIGKVGMTGRTTGPHLHWEAGTGWNGGVLTGRFDALTRYSKYAPFNTQPGPGVALQTPAQISAPSQQSAMVPFSLTPERNPIDIIIAEQPKSKQNVVNIIDGGGEQFPTKIDQSQLLNTFIKKKLLLDLAYL